MVSVSAQAAPLTAQTGTKAAESQPVRDWSLRGATYNDDFLRTTFDELLATSTDAPPEQRLVMYAADDDQEIKTDLGVFRKRLDPRRNTKPKKPEAQLKVCTPFDPAGFNFSKIRNPAERLVLLQLQTGHYEVLTNKFPLFSRHMLLVAKDLVPQQLNLAHLLAITELIGGCSFSAYFNSWGASASVNHFHCHLVDELPPVAQLPLALGPFVSGVRCMTPDGFSGFCYVFPSSRQGAHQVNSCVRAMQDDNQPHNLLFTPKYIYVWPKPVVRPERSFTLYPETVGGPELIGSFTVYTEEDFGILTPESVAEAARINTAPLPSRMLQFSDTLDDACNELTSRAGIQPYAQRLPRASKSLDTRSLDTWMAGASSTVAGATRLNKPPGSAGRHIPCVTWT